MAETPPEGNVSKVQKWMNEPDTLDERKQRAQAALDAEAQKPEDEQRSTLKASANQILEDDGNGDESGDGEATNTTQTATDPTANDDAGTDDPDAARGDSPRGSSPAVPVADRGPVVATEEEYDEGEGVGPSNVDPTHVERDGRLVQVAQVRTR